MKVRAKTKDGTEVVGWYVQCLDRHFAYVQPKASSFDYKHDEEYGRLWTVTGFVEIEIKSAAVDTGKLDKHGKMIFGSKGEMQGGDRIRYRTGLGHARLVCDGVRWNADTLQWAAMRGAQLASIDIRELEIIPPGKEARK